MIAPQPSGSVNDGRKVVGIPPTTGRVR